jgi:hypothetical protein
VIWIFLRTLKRWLLLLIVPPPCGPRLPVIDKNEPCPACGHSGGWLRCVVADGVAVDHDKLAAKDPAFLKTIDGVAVQITCNECGAQWFKQTVYEMVTKKKPEVTV